MTYNQVSKYVSMMRDLCIKKTNGIMAPHKAIMLLSIIELIENGKIKSNVIPIDYIISDIFRINWMKYVANNERFLYIHVIRGLHSGILKTNPFGILCL